MCCAQDIAVVPFLVLLPLVEGDGLVGQPGQSTMTLLTSLGPTVLQTLLGLGVLLVGGRVVLRRIFEMVRAHYPPAMLLNRSYLHPQELGSTEVAVLRLGA